MKAFRITDPVRGETERLDILNLMKVVGISTAEEAIALLGRVPAWVCDPARRLAEPWFRTSSPSDAMREYLTFASPVEFASRNIFTEERPLRRARGPQTDRV